MWVLHGKFGRADKGLGEAPKAARGRSMKAQPTQSRGGVKGQLPLAGSRDSVPCGGWGNAPTVPRPTNPKEAANKGAGSEASLPVTLRVRRRAPKLLFPQDSVMNHHLCVLEHEKRPAGGWRSRAKGWLYELAGCNRRFKGAFRRTLKPFGSAPLQSSPARALCHRQEGRF